MGFFLFLAQLCRTNKFYVSASVYIALSQFSDARCRGFESLRAHLVCHPFYVVLGLLCISAFRESFFYTPWEKQPKID